MPKLTVRETCLCGAELVITQRPAAHLDLDTTPFAEWRKAHAVCREAASRGWDATATADDFADWHAAAKLRRARVEAMADQYVARLGKEDEFQPASEARVGDTIVAWSGEGCGGLPVGRVVDRGCEGEMQTFVIEGDIPPARALPGQPNRAEVHVHEDMLALIEVAS